MSNDEKDTKIEQVLIELKAYIDQINMLLQSNVQNEMSNAKDQYKEIIILAGELNAYFK